MSIYPCFSSFSFLHPFLFYFLLLLLFLPLFFFLPSFPFTHFLFFTMQSKLLCSFLYSQLASAEAQFSRLEHQLSLFLIGQYYLWFPCSPSQFPVLYTLVITVCRKCGYMSTYFCDYLLDLLPLVHRHKSSLTRNKTQTTQATFPSKGKNKRNKDYNTKVWVKRPSSRAKQGKKLKYREYSTNERTRYKLTRPDKYGEEISHLSETEFRQ